MRILELSFTVLISSLFLKSVHALTCNSDQLLITIKTPEGEYDLDLYERYELRATIAYSVRKYCGGDNPAFETPAPASQCPNPKVGTDDVIVSEPTPRISCCVKVTDFSPDVVRAAIKGSKANLNGALLLTDDVLFVDGIEPTLEPLFEPEFAYWLIAYIVIFCLIILAGIAMLLYTRFHKKEDDEEKELFVDEGGENVYENVDEKSNTNGGFQSDRFEEATAL
uniref:angiotensin-converting enzyme 2-like n=1 Tax=Styela clava TaxID=7725 RepID=UPI00193AAC7E|nr:angiotensin-converting enzyme 2-like [Styela clava]